MELRLFLNTIDKQNKFSLIVNNIFYQNYDIDLYADNPNRSVDAKSIMAMYGFDLSKCVYVYINTKEQQVLNKFISDLNELTKEK